MTPLLQLHNATIASQGKVILRSISMQVNAGQKLLIGGPSGCGKSSLIRTLLGFTEITTGEFSYQGQPMTPAQMTDFRHSCGYIPQELDVGAGSVEAWVQEALLFCRVRVGMTLERFHEQLALVRLPKSILTKDLQQLSRGERQRLTLATIMSRQPSVFLLDEVTSALEADLKQPLVDHFSRLKDVTVIAISHDTAWHHHQGFDHFAMETP